jgi:hypothetical protein
LIAVDTNVLVHAHRAGTPFHDRALACLTELAEGRAPWVIPWPCLHEFVAVVTHPRIFAPPTPLARALLQVESWLESPSLLVLGESDEYWPVFAEIARAGRISGPRTHDARIAALCRLYGVRELWSADRDFSRFPGLVVHNPLRADAAHETAPAYRRHRPPGARLRRRK